MSSILKTKTPLCRFAKSQLKTAIRALPICKRPVGEGAKRTRIMGLAGQDLRLIKDVWNHRLPGAASGRNQIRNSNIEI
ncbi:MAG: hypothetical protein AAB243_00500, partial [Planctomycetota bacterium]